MTRLKLILETVGMSWLYHIGLSKMVSNYVYYKNYGKMIDFDNPKTLDEKLMVLKHTEYWRNSLISQCADKYGVRSYVTEKGCPEILTELVAGQVYDSVDQIDWENLPNQFVLKCTHGCKMNYIVSDKSKADKDQAFRRLAKWQKEKFGYQTGEWQYLSIKPRIICEKYYGAIDGVLPVDYKMFCIRGKVICTLVCSERESGALKLIFMDNDWHRMPIDTAHLSDDYIPDAPSSLLKMKRYAELLSKDFPFVRVDFYEYNGEIVLSELTFTPALNCMTYITPEGQTDLGKLLDISGEPLM